MPVRPGCAHIARHSTHSPPARWLGAMLGLVLASPALASCALFPHDSGPSAPFSPQAAPETEGCPPGFLENLNPDQGFVQTSVEAELGNDPLSTLPFFQHVCMGNGFPLETHTAFFGCDEQTLQVLGDDLVAYGFQSGDGMDLGDGYVSMSWHREDPFTLVTATTFGGSPEQSIYGYDATALMTPSFCVLTVE